MLPCFKLKNKNENLKLEFQSAAAGALRQAFNSSVITIAAAIKHRAGNFQFAGKAGNLAPDRKRRSAFSRQIVFFRGLFGARIPVAASGQSFSPPIVNQLSENMPVGPENAKPRRFAGARDLGAHPPVAAGSSREFMACFIADAHRFLFFRFNYLEAPAAFLPALRRTFSPT